MKTRRSAWWLPIVVLAVLSAPASASVSIVSLTPALRSPQPIGAIVGWTAKATDTDSGPLTFQFNVAPPNGTLATVKQFNVGTLSSGTWKSIAFAWALTGMDGTYQVQVVAKDFTSGESASKTASFTVTSPLTGATPLVQATQNPLVALFTAPSCPAGSTARVSFQPQSGSVPATNTNWVNCQPPATVTFEIAGMYPTTAYSLYAQVNTGGNIVNGPSVSFTTGAIPTNLPFPTFQIGIPDNPNDPNRVLLHSLFAAGAGGSYMDVATDLSGNVIWYYFPNDEGHTAMMTRSFPYGFIAAQSGTTWMPGVHAYEVLRLIDWAGNIIRETNTGIVSQQLVALGDPDGALCSAIPRPPKVTSACIGIFNHDAIMTLPNGYTAAILDLERIYPAGTQGDTTGLPVDIGGDVIVVLDQNWNVVWYWDAYDPNGGGNGYPQLPISRTAVLNEQCGGTQSACLTTFLLGPGIAPKVHDWLHGNALYYWPHDGAGTSSTAPGDLIYSSRHQDWVVKIDYQDGAGTGDILWRMGPSGDFTFENTYNDRWPWFSHQHETGIENNGAGPFTAMDNGNTRLSPPTGPGSSTGGVPGLGKKCGPVDCHSRGMALTFDESTMQVLPVLSVDLGVTSSAMGSAQLLADGNYYFLAGIVDISGDGFDIQIQPTPGTDTGIQVLNISESSGYRAWQMPDLYSPPIT